MNDPLEEPEDQSTAPEFFETSEEALNAVFQEPKSRAKKSARPRAPAEGSPPPPPAAVKKAPAPAAAPKAARAAAEAQKRKVGTDSVRNLQAMVEDLLQKIRDSEELLKEREAALLHLRNENLALHEKIAREQASGRSGNTTLETLDLFAPPGQTGALPAGTKATATRELRAARAKAQGAPSGPACPACGARLRNAKCMDVGVLVCVPCRGAFVDGRSVRRLAPSQTWFRCLEEFLSAPPRGPGQRPPRPGQTQKLR